MWGTLFSTIQMSIFERDELTELFFGETSWQAISWLFCFWVCLFAIYSIMPYAFQISSAVFVNLGLVKYLRNWTPFFPP